MARLTEGFDSTEMKISREILRDLLTNLTWDSPRTVLGGRIDSTMHTQFAKGFDSTEIKFF